MGLVPNHCLSFYFIPILGVQRIIYGCYDKETEEKVEEESCQFLEAPDREDVACERINCEDLKYAIYSIHFKSIPPPP